MNTSNRHIPFVQLADLAEGRMGTEEQVRARAHIRSCARCTADTAWLEHTIGLMRTDTSEDAPAHVIARAERLIRAPRPLGPLRLRQRLAAALHFDSARMPLAPGLRAAHQSERQLLFSADRFDLDLRITRSGALWVLAGQVLGPDMAGQVTLQGPAGTAEATLNELSEFRLPPLPVGTYTLTLRLADVDVEIEALEIGE